MLYQWFYSCFRGDKKPSIRLNAAVLCHFLLGKLSRKKRNISQGKFSQIIHTMRGFRRDLMSVSTLRQHIHESCGKQGMMRYIRVCNWPAWTVWNVSVFLLHLFPSALVSPRLRDNEELNLEQNHAEGAWPWRKDAWWLLGAERLFQGITLYDVCVT